MNITVTPKGLVDVCEIPEECGLMEIKDGVIEVCKKPLFNPNPKIDLGFIASIARRGTEMSDKDYQTMRRQLNRLHDRIDSLHNQLRGAKSQEWN